MAKNEIRTLQTNVEVRSSNDSQTIGGYAALFNVETMIGDWFREKIDPAAFSQTLEGDIRALIDHDHGRVIGRTAAKTLRVSTDNKGLVVDIDLPKTNDGNDLGVSIERGDITGMSFGFAVKKDLWDETGDIPLRTILEVDLFEVSVVAFPAYDDTSIALRSLEKVKKQNNFNAANKRLQMKANLDLRTRGLGVKPKQ